MSPYAMDGARCVRCGSWVEDAGEHADTTGHWPKSARYFRPADPTKEHPMTPGDRDDPWRAVIEETS